MATQNAQRAHKVEVVAEVKTRIGEATASIVSEYRGLTTGELAELRESLAAVGGDYRIFKNTLVRLAIDGGDYQPLSEYLSGPSALTSSRATSALWPRPCATSPGPTPSW
jgi:large subunit ribosomal protein L10